MQSVQSEQREGPEAQSRPESLNGIETVASRYTLAVGCCGMPRSSFHDKWWEIDGIAESESVRLS